MSDQTIYDNLARGRVFSRGDRLKKYAAGYANIKWKSDDTDVVTLEDQRNTIDATGKGWYADNATGEEQLCTNLEGSMNS